MFIPEVPVMLASGMNFMVIHIKVKECPGP